MSPQQSNRLKSISARIINVAQEQGHDPNRVRRQLAFQRLIARFAGAGWVLKGGYCLELRLGNQARTTKDMDLVRREAVHSADALLDELDGLLAGADDDDGFTFDPVTAVAMRAPGDPHTAWRVSMDVRVDGHPFSSLKLDIVSQFDEVADAVEPLEVPPPVPALGPGPVSILAVDVHQHAAEKFHAMSRVYSGDRPSSRVKDLVDLALLFDAGLLTDLYALRSRILRVHELRDGAPPPGELPTPPRDWDARYEHLIGGLDLSLTTCDAAFARVHDLYRAALVAQN